MAIENVYLSSSIAILAIENAFLAIVNDFSENERSFAIAAYPVCSHYLQVSKGLDEINQKKCRHKFCPFCVLSNIIDVKGHRTP